MQTNSTYFSNTITTFRDGTVHKPSPLQWYQNRFWTQSCL